MIMLIYDKITDLERLDTSEGTDIIQTVWCLLSSVTFVTSTFTKTETLKYQAHASLSAQLLTDFMIIITKSSVYRIC